MARLAILVVLVSMFLLLALAQPLCSSSSETNAFYSFVEVNGIRYLVFNPSACDLYYRGVCVVHGARHGELLTRTSALYGSLGLTIPSITISVAWDELMYTRLANATGGGFLEPERRVIRVDDERIKPILELGLKVLDITLYASGVIEVRVYADSTIPVKNPHELVRLLGNLLQRPIGLKQVVVLVIPYKEEHTGVSREFWSRIDEMLDWFGDEGFLCIGASPWTWLNLLCFNESLATSLEDIKAVIDKLKDTFELPDDYPLLLKLSGPLLPEPLYEPEQPSALTEIPRAENVNGVDTIATETPSKQSVEGDLESGAGKGPMEGSSISEHGAKDYKIFGVLALATVVVILVIALLAPRFILKRHS